MATLLTNVSNEVLRQMRPGERRLILAKFSDPVFRTFARKQAEYIRIQMANLDPDEDDFVKAAKELRLILQFWADLESFAQDWTAVTGETLDEGE